jgi:hypothetical protein
MASGGGAVDHLPVTPCVMLRAAVRLARRARNPLAADAEME